MMVRILKAVGFIFLVFPLILSGQTVSDTNFSGVVGAGARAFGMGGAFIAIADDATSASWNPAGLGQLERPEVTLVLRFQNYRNMSPAGGDGRSFYDGAEDRIGNSYGFDFLSFTYPVKIGNFKLVPQISYQRAINYKLDLKANAVRSFFPMIHPVLQIPVEIDGEATETQSYRGGLDVVSLSLGSRLFDWLCVGVSANLWLNGYEGLLNYQFTGSYSALDGSGSGGDWYAALEAEEDVDIDGITFNFGVLADVTEKFKIGAVYKKGFNTNARYKVRSIGTEGGTGYTWDTSETDFSPLNWPATYGLGFSYRPMDQLTISMDFTETRWAGSILKDFPMHDGEADDAVSQDVYFPTFEPVENDTGFKQYDSRQFRLGLEYVLIGKRAYIPLRLGFFVDSQYFPDASGAQVVFFGVTAGFGIKRGGFSVDFAALLEAGSYLDNKFDYGGTYFTEVRAYLSTSYSF